MLICTVICHSNEILPYKGGIMDFSDIMIIYHKTSYADDAVSQLAKLLSELHDHVTETYAWRLTYKGEKHGHAISGTRKKPITDKAVIALMSHMVKYMKKLGENQ